MKLSARRSTSDATWRERRSATFLLDVGQSCHAVHLPSDGLDWPGSEREEKSSLERPQPSAEVSEAARRSTGSIEGGHIGAAQS